MTTFDEIKERVLSNLGPSPELEAILADIKAPRNPDMCWQVQTRWGKEPWIPMTGFTGFGAAQARSTYWKEIMPGRDFRVKLFDPENKPEASQRAIEIAVRFGGIEGDHHKAWVIDQMVRALTGCPMVEQEVIACDGQPYTFDTMGESEEYLEVVRKAKNGEDGPETYTWETGIAP